jgi:translation elongation factor EF-1beta
VAQVSVDALEENITNLEELVQSVDIAAMNKI